ncbi:MAG TPA: DUF3365 domain-containing protein [Pricia sp.]|nr:DUF3365 domain-containing protein [Pricia sp.]
MKNLLLLLSLVIIFSCKDKSKTIPVDTTSENEVAQPGENHPGRQIMETECYICHDPKASEESMIAPPMIAIKSHYIGENTTKDQFTEDLIKWVNDPETESKIPAAHKRFGAMPYIPYPDDAVAQIADYLYDYEVEKPDWFDAHYKAEHGKGKGMGKRKIQTTEAASQDNNAKIGMEYALAAKSALGKNLMKAIQQNGPVGAVEFCSVKALALTDSISIMKNAVINRVSDKPRNTDNAANTEELGYISYFKKLVAAGKQPKPIVKTQNGEVDFYFPITTNTMCLQCHGKPNEQIAPATLTALKHLYPKDKAIGYDENEVRGLWAINFDEEN